MDDQRQLFDLTGDYVAILDNQYRVEFMNLSGRILLGVSIDHDLNVEPLHIRQFHDDASWEELQQCILPRTLYEGAWSGIWQLRARSGEPIPVCLRALAHLDDQGQSTGLTLVCQDLRLQQAFQAQEAMVTRILDGTVEGIMVTDPHASIQRVNRAFTQITGYLPEEVKGRSPRFLRSNQHDRDFYDSLRSSLRQDGFWQGEMWCRRKSGEVSLQSVSISALRNDDGCVSHYVAIFHDLTDMRAWEAEIAQLAFVDPHTGMGNRYSLVQTLRHKLVRERLDRFPLALICVDLGQLSPINDRFGIKGGDELIRFQSQKLRQLEGPLQFFRLTGDEFVILVSDASDLTSLARFAVQCVQKLQVPNYLQGEQIRLSPSVGISLAPKDARDTDVLLACAQTAMNAAKQAGRDCYRFYDEGISHTMRQRLMLEQQLRLATQPEADLGLELYLQPKVTLPAGQIQGAEALLRWNHPEKGMIAPAEFIPLAEESRLILALDRWVFARTCRTVKRWRLLGLKMPRISINLSARHLQEPDLVNWCVETVMSCGLVPGDLELEITETAFVNLADMVLKQLVALRHAGFSLALDDFGAGYSSLTYLCRLPLDVVKIDRALVADLCQDERAAILLRGVVQLLDRLGFSVVAEGVETDQQADLLHAIGCTTGQGYLFYRPMPADDFIRVYQDYCIAIDF
ncbi:hypothetical protein GCM10011352_04310 [Marinobacterium zhoushanense]|uniref:PAS domain S-box-containing protein/diguanylate cyclase (GGDEF)-like protein n=1 Tax=Marinobacterium zhoushanense TaxID=1679163 RepID=A0ABQ1JZP6_9GAMM|nr:bifunctional diguanylate cyclase/phosphodiesterase [Marinobacterium zhoushanense]GGB81688.1 hypothetical protein GCM10011352_04310 [Marinobacterium zhoushanense]